jgi:beta-glucosidase
MDSLTIMTSYASYDGVPTIANSHIMVDIVRCGTLRPSPLLTYATQLRKEWGYKYFATSDAGSVDLLITLHGTCGDRACAARTVVENLSGEMGGGTYTFETLPDQVRNGSTSITPIDETVKTILRAKFSLGLFESAFLTLLLLPSPPLTTLRATRSLSIQGLCQDSSYRYHT